MQSHDILENNNDHFSSKHPNDNSTLLSILHQEIAYKEAIQENMKLMLQLMKEGQSLEASSFYRSFTISLGLACLFTFSVDQIVYVRYLVLHILNALNAHLTATCQTTIYFQFSFLCDQLIPFVQLQLSTVTQVSSTMNLGCLLFIFLTVFTFMFLTFRMMDHHITCLGFSISKPWQTHLTLLTRGYCTNTKIV